MARSKMPDIMVKTKFLLFHIKKIVRDRRGRFVYADAFDQVIEDVYGVKHLVRDINDCYDNRDVIDSLEACGIDTLIKMFSNPRLKSILIELVEAKFMMEELRRDIRKRSKKGRARNKGDIKKYKFLSERYKRGSKFLRKRLGIKSNKDAYKNQFRALNELDSDNFYTGNGFLSGGDDFFDDDWGFDGYDDDEEDDYYARSELDDFVLEMTGKNPRDDMRRIQNDIKRKARSQSRFADIDFDDLYDDDDDEDYDSIEKELTEDVDERIDKMADSIAILADSVNAMMSKNEYDRNVARRQRAVQDEDLDELERFRKMGESMRMSQREPSDEDLYQDLQEKKDQEFTQMRKLMNAMASRVQELTESYGDLVDSQNEIIDAYNDLVGDEPAANTGDEIVVEQEITEIPANNPDRKTPQDPSNLSREELIDQINHSQEFGGPEKKAETATDSPKNDTPESSK